MNTPKLTDDMMQAIVDSACRRVAENPGIDPNTDPLIGAGSWASYHLALRRVKRETKALRKNKTP
jgi:hypothetical protein